MKTTSKSLFATAALVALAFAGTAQAITLTVEYTTDVKFDDNHLTATGTFDLTASPTAPSYFSPALQDITAATATFVFDDKDGYYSIDVNLGSYDFKSQSEIHADITFSDTLTANMLFDLNTDGKISYTITASSMGGNDEFRLDSAKLVATVENQTNSVPEGGSTIALLGAGFAALGLFSRLRKIA